MGLSESSKVNGAFTRSNFYLEGCAMKRISALIFVLVTILNQAAYGLVVSGTIRDSSGVPGAPVPHIKVCIMNCNSPFPANVSVKVGGHQLDPGIQNRTYNAVAPNTINITWPDPE